MVQLVFTRGKTRGWGRAKATLSSGTYVSVDIDKTVDGDYAAILLYMPRYLGRNGQRMVGHRILRANKRKDLVNMIEKFLV